MKDLKGKTAVVTGAASGIGLAMAERFAAEGMNVVLSDVDEAHVIEAAAAVGKSGAKTLALRADVSKVADVDALAKKTFETFGTAHVVCNNAGVAVGGFMWEREAADWDWVVGVNLMGVVNGVRAFVPKMVEQGEGHVVNTASIAGLLSVAGMSPYCATKHAVVTMTECLHHELTMATGGKVHTSVLCPGWVKTAIASSERNRPAGTKKGAAKRELAPHEKLIQDMTTQAVANGIPPSEVADQVVRAILEERFYIFTHPKMLGAFKKRAEDILAQRNPTFDPSAF
jgi:NAD(P)-dependent dehydrogenase (short-subunit alcohol dehydrogenase family)